MNLKMNQDQMTRFGQKVKEKSEKEKRDRRTEQINERKKGKKLYREDNCRQWGKLSKGV